MPERRSTGSPLSPIAAIARSLASGADAREVAQRIAEAAVELTGARGAYVERTVSSGEMVEIVAAAGEGTPPPGTRVPYPGSTTGEAPGADRPREGLAPSPAGRCEGCPELVAPLLSGDEVLGALVLIRAPERVRSGEDEAAGVGVLADLASAALRRVRLLEQGRRERDGLLERERAAREEAERRAREEAALHELARELGAKSDIRGVVEAVTRSAVEVTRAFGAYVERIESPDGEVEVVAAAGEGTPPLGTRVPYPGSLTEEVIESGSPAILAEVAKIGERMAPYLAESCRRCTGLIVPLVSGGEMVGTLALLRSPERGPFRREELAFARSIGNTASAALARAALVESLRESEMRFRSLAENAAEAIITIDAGDAILFANPAVEEIFGYPAEELRGLRFTALIPERFRERHRAGMARHIATGERRIPWDGIELPGLHRDGREIPLEVTFGEFVRNGRYLFTGIMRDVSERKRAEKERERLLQREHFLAEANATLVSSIDYETTLRSVARLSVPFLADFCVIDVVDEDGRLRRIASEHTDRAKEALAREAERYPPDPALTEHPVIRAIRSGEAEVVPDFTDAVLRASARSPEHLALMKAIPPRSVLVVPLVALGRTLGAIQLMSMRDESNRVYGADDLALAEELARRAAVAIENARLYREAEEARERSTFLAEASLVLASSLDYQATLEQVARLAVPRIADYCLIDVLEEDGRLRRVGAAHVDPDKEEVLAEIRLYAPAAGSRSPALRVAETGRPELVAHVSEEWMEEAAQSPEHLDLMRRLAPGSVIVVPLTARGRTLGILWLAASESGRRYGARDLALAEELARRAGVAVDNADLYQAAEEARGEAERRAREEAALREAAGAVAASASTEEVIRRIAGSAVEATDADGAFVERIDDAVGEVVVVATAGAMVPAVGSRAPYAGSFAERVVERAEPEIVPRLADADRHLPGELTRARPDASALVVPLVDGGEPIGALLLLRGSGKWRFRPDEVERAHTFADLAALAFRKIHMLEDSERRREELQRVMESRARLMRGFSHDVKNPLGAADGFLALLEDGIVGELAGKQRESVGRARRAIGSSLALIEDLLELARAEAGQIEIEWAPVDVRDAVRELGEEYRAQAQAKGLRMEIRLPDELPVIQSDATRVRQILGNLFSNAVKYTDRGGVRVAVELRSGEGARRPGEWIATDVRDTGPGIPKEKRRLLFQEFTRLDPGEKKGAGVGLAISQRIAHALGGEITAGSEEGEGSTFTLWLPCARGASPAEL